MEVIDQVIGTRSLNQLQDDRKSKISKPARITAKMVKEIIKELKGPNSGYVRIAQKHRIRKEVVAEIHRKMKQRARELTVEEELS